jgi:hypothetical protein
MLRPAIFHYAQSWTLCGSVELRGWLIPKVVRCALGAVGGAIRIFRRGLSGESITRYIGGVCLK